MDANGSRYRLLLGEEDWGRCSDGGSGAPLAETWNAPTPATSLYWDAAHHQVSLAPLVYAFVPGKGDRGRTLADRRGAAADRFGNWYFIDGSQTQIRVRSSGSQATTAFWHPAAASPAPPRGGAFGPVAPPAPATPRDVRGLAVTTGHFLVAGTRAPGGFLVFDLYSGGSPREYAWPALVPFEPFDMTPAPGGGLHILDAANKRYWTLDADFAVCTLGQDTVTQASPAPTFQPVAGPPVAATAHVFPAGHLLDAASPVAGANPVAIESLPDGSVLILDRPAGATSAIEHYRGGTLLAAPYPLDRMAALLPPGTTMDFTGHDLAFVSTPGGDPLAGVVLVALASGDQCLAFAAASNPDGTLRLAPLPEYYPMRLFAGRAIVSTGSAAAYDFADRFVPLLAQKRQRFVEDGALVTPPFDSGLPGCVWHRLILDATIPLDSTIVVSTRAADDQATLAATPFVPELPQGRRLVARSTGSELPFAALPRGLASWELLFQRARGRFLQIRLELAGNGKHSPRLRALRAYYPRFSYRNEYLPAVYAASDTSGFLDRFLANVEGTLTSIEDRIAAAQAVFDPTSAPSETLDWLAGWFSLALDPNMTDLQRRLFVRHAMDLFQWRGTVRGIQMALDLALSAAPCDAIFERADAQPAGTRIIEQFVTRFTPAVVAGDPTGTQYVATPAPAGARWTPDQGGARLLGLWQAAAVVGGLPLPTSFPLAAPADAATAAAWVAFTSGTLGFVPSSSDRDQTRWTSFLYHRYLTVSALNAAYATSYGAFVNALRPTTLPPDGAALVDWFQFEGTVMAMAQTAHRFRVLVPLAPGETADSPAQQQRLDLVTRLVTLEQPAHTTFDVRFYWAMFRVGQVRLGYDTLLDTGSRVPALAPSLVLGATHLLDGHLAPAFPQDATDRTILGRDPLGPNA